MTIKNNQLLFSRNDIKEIHQKHEESKTKLPAVASRFISRKSLEHQLADAIPRGGKNKVLRRMAKLFDESKVVENYKLAQDINPTIRGNAGLLRKRSKKDYLYDKEKYDERIKNHFRGLKKY